MKEDAKVRYLLAALTDSSLHIEATVLKVQPKAWTPP